jgi:hypothetical protein
MTTTSKVYGSTPEVKKTGLGHQLKADQKALEAAKHSIETAYGDLMPLHVRGSFGFRMTEIMNNLRIASIELEGLALAANEAYNQND